MSRYSALDNIHVNEILEYAPDGMFTVDSNLTIQYVNPAFCNLLKYSREELIGTSILDYLGDLSIFTSCMAAVQKDGHCNDQETVFKRKDGSVVHISKNVQALYNKKGEMQNILVSIRDLTHLHELNKELSASKTTLENYSNNLEAIVRERTNELTQRLLYDSLTKLPNRIKLLNDINDLQKSHTVILFNIDSFKEINSFYGHTIGDQLLLNVSEALVDFSRHLSSASVYKFPVDEYVILIKGTYTQPSIEAFVSELSYRIANQTFVVFEHEISLSATIGVATSHLDSNDDQDLLSRADMALKRAKKTRSDYLIYHPRLHIKEDYEKNLLWIKRLRHAIEKDLIVPFYQPIVNAKTDKVEKYEALVRIVEEDGTVIPPAQFLEVSKKVKLYHHITRRMIEKVFEALEAHPDKTCSINLSIEDINDVQMNTFIVERIRNNPVSSRIIFEILESEGIENYDTVNEFITEVKNFGVKIALDDFGAGYSNFAYIAKLNVDYIKIDGSIIQNIDEDISSQIITETIVDFASKLHIQTIAEFVASEDVYQYVKTLPINYLQGFYFSEPLRTMK